MGTAASIVPRVILGAPRDRKQDLEPFAQGILAAFTGNVSYPNPDPALSVVAAAIARFSAAQLAANTRAAGTVSARDDAWHALLAVLHHLRDFVQRTIESSPANAISIIESAGMKVAKQPARSKPELAVQQGDVSTVVILTARALAGSAVYYWEYSLDQKAWTTAPEGFQASTTIGGLTSGQTYSFRFRALTRTGKTDYSQVVSFLVK